MTYLQKFFIFIPQSYTGKNNSVILFFECYCSVAHLLDDGEGFDSRALLFENLSAGLEAFFNGDADALKLGTRLVDYIDKSRNGGAVCKEIVDDEYLVALVYVVFDTVTRLSVPFVKEWTTEE